VGEWLGGVPVARVRLTDLAVGQSRQSAWTRAYLFWVRSADGACAFAAGLVGLEVRFGRSNPPLLYLVFTLALPLLWVMSLGLAGAYDSRFVGVGSDEFRRVLNAGVSLTASVAVASYLTKTDFARGYVVIALPFLTTLDLLARYSLRKRLHKLRRRGRCMRNVVAVGYEQVIADLASALRRDSHHGLRVVAACVVGGNRDGEIGGIPVSGGLDTVDAVVDRFEADTVAVLACPEMSGIRLRELAWKLERTGTDLCVAPALLDVAGPRTSIRPVAGLPLLHMDHPEFTGFRRVIKSAFDRTSACLGLVVCSPVFVAVAVAVKFADGGPVFFRQDRVGRDGRLFKVYKFRTMVRDAEDRKAELVALNESDGVLFKIRRDPRVTAVGIKLRRWSLDELPQLINVVMGDMSMVGPRPPLPEEAELYAEHVRRRLVVKPGITGLWQVNGRSDLPWDEAVRLDLRYVENWSFALDLQILWKTISAIARGSGAY
jgi:exopolysaccharide biosynthesis polyprenyl glycosylphosphotransferase